MLAGCGDGPPSSLARDKVAVAVRSFEGDLQCGVESIDIGSFARKEAMGLVAWEAPWSAKLRIDEDIAVLLDRVAGRSIVAVLARAGERLAYDGKLIGGKLGDQWSVDADTEHSGLDELFERARKLRDEYPGGAGSDGSVPAIGRASVRARSKFGECVEAGSAEEKQLRDEAVARLIAQQQARERQQEAQRAAAAAKQKADEEARAEAKRKADEEAAERARKAKEDADRRTEEARLARLMPLLAPFQGEHGVVMLAGFPEGLSSVVLQSKVDVEAKTVNGSGVDLGSLPPRDFTFTATANDAGRGSLALTTSLDAAPKTLVAGADGVLVMGRALTLRALDADARARLDRCIERARTLSTAAPIDLAIEVLDAGTCKMREAALEPIAIDGTVLFRGAPYPQALPIFGAALLGKRPLSWSRETLSIRLAEPATARALFVKGANVATDNLRITVNGVHRVNLAAIAAEGGAIVTLPEGLPVIDLRFEAIGRVSTRGIVFLR